MMLGCFTGVAEELSAGHAWNEGLRLRLGVWHEQWVVL